MPARSDWPRHLSSPEQLPVYALVGEEGLLLGEAVAALRATALTTAPDFNRDEFKAGQTPIAQVVEAARTLPMMAPLRWVHLSDCHLLKAADTPALIAYLKAPSKSTLLCLSGTRMDLRTKLGQGLSKGKFLFQIEGPKRAAVVPWVQKRMKEHGFQITTEAAHLLVDLVGGQVGDLNMALLKAGTYARGETVEVEHIESTVAATRVHTVFELTDAVGARNLPKASRLLRNLLDGGQNGLMVLTMIVRQLRQLIHLKELQTTGIDQDSIARKIGVRPFLMDQLTRQAKSYTPLELRRCLQSASEVDIQLKGSPLNPGVVLDRFLLEMIERSQ